MFIILSYVYRRRMKNYLRKKIKLAKFISKIFQIIPYIRMIAVCDSVARGTAKPESDIDLFIVAKNNHIFTTRYIAVFLITILGLKSLPKEKKIANKICLSFFLNNKHLNLDRLSKDSKEEILRAEWIMDLIPIFDESHTYLDFVDKNSWVKKINKNYYSVMIAKSKNIRSLWLLYILRKFLEFILFFGIGWILEHIVRSIQVKRLFNFKNAHFGCEKMIINDQIIKLHYIDKNGKKFLF